MIGAAATGFGAHAWHIALLGVWPPVFGLVVTIERIRSRRSARARVAVAAVPVDAPGRTGRPAAAAWCQLTALGSICAAAIHAVVMPDHFEESLWYGGFFLACALAQIGLGLLVLVRPTRRLLLSASIGSAVVVVLWLVTRLVGVPIGPDNGATEPFGLLDGLASGLEAATAVCAALALAAWTGRPAWRWSQWSTVVRAVTPVCLVATVLASVLAPRG